VLLQALAKIWRASMPNLMAPWEDLFSTQVLNSLALTDR
jgi:hypothetical protein